MGGNGVVGIIKVGIYLDINKTPLQEEYFLGGRMVLSPVLTLTWPSMQGYVFLKGEWFHWLTWFLMLGI